MEGPRTLRHPDWKLPPAPCQRSKSRLAVGFFAVLFSVGLLLTGEAVLIRAQAQAQGLTGADGPGLTIARLKYGGGGDWYSNPSSLPNLAEAIRKRTSVVVTQIDEARVSILDPDFFSYPYLYMNGHGVVRFTESEVDRLRKYLLAGGFLFADDNYGMDESFRKEMQRVFPDRKLVEVPFSHPIYHCFYDLPGGPPKVHEHDGKPSQGYGIFDGDRLIVFYTFQSDIGDGIEDDHVHKNPPEVREAAMRMAVNTVVYAMSY